MRPSTLGTRLMVLWAHASCVPCGGCTVLYWLGVERTVLDGDSTVVLAGVEVAGALTVYTMRAYCETCKSVRIYAGLVCIPVSLLHTSLQLVVSWLAWLVDQPRRLGWACWLHSCSLAHAADQPVECGTNIHTCALYNIGLCCGQRCHLPVAVNHPWRAVSQLRCAAQVLALHCGRVHTRDVLPVHTPILLVGERGCRRAAVGCSCPSDSSAVSTKGYVWCWVTLGAFYPCHMQVRASAQLCCHTHLLYYAAAHDALAGYHQPHGLQPWHWHWNRAGTVCQRRAPRRIDVVPAWCGCK